MPELLPSASTRQPWTVERRAVRPADAGTIYTDTASDGRVWLAIMREHSRYVMDFPHLAAFEIDTDRNAIGAFAHPGVGENTFRHLLLDHVIPHVLSLGDVVVLHSSAVATDGGAVVFTGPSGAGKSTLAASFSEQGCRSLADDFVVISESGSGIDVAGSYPGLRLWPDSGAAFPGGKRGLPVYDGELKRRVATEPPDGPSLHPLRAVVSVAAASESDPRPSFRRLSARDGFFVLFTNAFRMDRSGTHRPAEDFRRFTDFAAAVPIYELRYQRNYDALDEVRRCILSELAPPGTREPKSRKGGPPGTRTQT